VKIIVYHSGYGCESGCCGHVLEVDGQEILNQFDLCGHPDTKAEARQYAEDLIRRVLGEDHIKDLDWDSCKIISDDEE